MGVKGRRIRKFNDEPSLTKGVEGVIKIVKEKCFIKDKYKINIEALINSDSNIELKFDDEMESSISGSLIKDKENNKWVLRVNSKHHPKRQRFTMAHEYAHFILHKDTRGSFVDEEIFFRKDKSSSIEYNADKFASELLMPEDLFLKAVREDGIKDVKELSNLFEVSAMAVKLRADELKKLGV